MSNSSGRPGGPDASREDAPPSYEDSQHTGQTVPELPGDVPEATPESASTSASNTSPERPRQKTEGSVYASSYRPADARQAPPPATTSATRHGFDSGQVEDSPPTPDDEALPAYSEIPGQITDNHTDLGANAVVADDGRVNIRINQKNRTLSQFFAPQLQRQLSQLEQEPAPPPPYVPELLGGAPGKEPPPPLNVVIHVVGSRGDVQPFVALGKVLKETYNHRVRLATHPTFKDFVIENGLEFFSIGGDPAELMAFMVKNPGLMPGFDTLRSGDVGKRRKGIAEILRGTWRSCIESGNGLGVDPLKQSVEEWMGIEEQLPEELRRPFVADAIIANPPSFGHVHCAEKLGIPLHMMFTMPWSPTQQFPHPLANIQASNADASMTNFMSYTLVDMLTWQGLGDIINKFRKESLGLDPISMIWAPGMLARLKIPYTYCWSPALIPKPKDWGHHISISGFYFLSLAQNYTPAPELADFLAAGEPPVYIGFGSIVVDDPNAMTKMIFDAVKMTGKRALVSKGWGGLGADELGIPEGVFMLGNCPHDWLFKHVSAVVHHGGAGTTAAGIAAGRPTVVVPFFGDQPFWGAMTARAGAGPMPIPYKNLTAEKLAESINKALQPESLERAQELSNKISQEQGSQSGAQSFHQMLKYDDLRCSVAPSRSAAWRVKRTQVRLSAQAATVLAQEGELNFSELKLFRPREYETDEGPWDPVSGGASAIIGTASTMMMGVADFPIETLKLLKIHPETATKKGKGKASESESVSGDRSREGRERKSKPTINSAQESAASSTTTLPRVNTPGSPSSHARNSLDDVTEVASPGSPGTPTHRSNFMAQALAASSQVSRSRSRSRSRGTSTFQLPQHPAHARAKSISAGEIRSDAGSTSTFSDRLYQMNEESVVGTGKGIGKLVGAGFKSPMDFSVNVAKGFHNVPKLYGADVRKVDKVTDLKSGLLTAGKQFGLGVYDSVTGVVMDPYRGAKKEGGKGFIKGVGRGIFSVPFRAGAGFFSIPAYAMKGVYQEMMKGKSANVQNYIVAARISQGYDEASTISTEERADIISRWKCIRLNVKKKKNPGEEQFEALHSLLQEKRKRRHEHGTVSAGNPVTGENESHRGLEQSSSQTSLPGSFYTPSSRGTHGYSAPQHANTFPGFSQSRTSLDTQAASEEEAERRQMEAAIAASVGETSRGNPEEDEMISRAIRASMAELEMAPEGEDEEKALQRAMTASIEEASKNGASEEDQKALEETLRQSLLETSRARMRSSDSEWDSSDTEDDEDYQRIIAESKELADLHQNNPQEYNNATGGQDSGVIGASGNADADEEALKKALEESEKAEQERREELERQKNEEDIVMEYVKKQSLAEAEHRRRWEQGRDVSGESSGAAGGGA